MEDRTLADALAASPQIRPGDMPGIRWRDHNVMVCGRADGEASAGFGPLLADMPTPALAYRCSGRRAAMPRVRTAPADRGQTASGLRSPQGPGRGACRPLRPAQPKGKTMRNHILAAAAALAMTGAATAAPEPEDPAKQTS